MFDEGLGILGISGTHECLIIEVCHTKILQKSNVNLKPTPNVVFWLEIQNKSENQNCINVCSEVCYTKIEQLKLE